MVVAAADPVVLAVIAGFVVMFVAALAALVMLARRGTRVRVIIDVDRDDHGR